MYSFFVNSVSLLATEVVPSSSARIAEIQVGPSNRRIPCETDSCLARLGSKPQLGLAGLGKKGRPDWKHEETGRTRVLCADQKMPLGDSLTKEATRLCEIRRVGDPRIRG